jgi:hypothetical protein
MNVKCLGRVLLLCGLAARVAFGQEAPKVSPHEQAAREMLQVMGVTRLADAGAEAMMGVVRQNPDLAPYDDVVRSWYKRIYTGGDLEGEMAAVYMRYFSEEEMRALTLFCKTPLGQKTLEALPKIMKEGAEVGVKRAKEHQSELDDMLQKARAERAPAKNPN